VKGTTTTGGESNMKWPRISRQVKRWAKDILRGHYYSISDKEN
jgi:hypothetical protein